MKIVKLDIDENSILAGIDAVSLVEQPAIEEDFMYFSKLNELEFAETYTDYPEGAIEAAKMGIKRNEALGNKCGTQVGKVRAQQLANREPISLDTVRRMRAFLIRQKGNYELAIERKNYDACGYISYLLWGGPEALPWTEKIIRRVEGDEEMSQVFSQEQIVEEIIRQEMNKIKMIENSLFNDTEKSSFSSLDEKQMLVGPLMKPNQLIKRLDDDGEEYFVYFTEETIKKIAYKMMRDKLIDRVNIEHDSNDVVEDAYMVETWLVEDPETDKSRKYGFNPSRGEWFGIYKIDNKQVWDEYIKSGRVKGFSIEGYFSNYAMSKCTIGKNGQCVCGLSSNDRGLCDGSHLKK